MRLLNSLVLCLCLPLSVVAEPLLLDGGFEDAPSPWEAQSHWGTVVSFERNDAARSGSGHVRLRTYANVGDRFATVTQETKSLPSGVYELTVWSKGMGKLRLGVAGLGLRRFRNSDTTWAQYSYVFELPEDGPVTVTVEVQGEALVDDVALTPADQALRAAWARQQEALGRLYYIPSGYSAQRPAPGAPPRPAVDREPVPMTEKVVFYDPRYDASWNTQPELIAAWFAQRGFTVKGAPGLAAWMEERIAEGAYGSVVLMAMGLVPEVLITPLDETCLLRRYMDAGGRVVWTGNTALYVAQGETGPAHNPGERGMEEVLYLTCDWGIWTQEPPALTEAGERWGLQGTGSAIRAARTTEVTLSLSEAPGGEASAIWLVTTNPDYPLSGFIASVFSLDGGNLAALEDFYRMALYIGEVVTIPEPVVAEAAAPVLTLSTRGNGVPRRAFTREEQIAVSAEVAAEAVDGERVLTLSLTGEAPGFDTYDMAGLGVAEGQAQVAAYRARLSRLTALWTETRTVQGGTRAAAEVGPFVLDTAALPVGDYLLRAELREKDGAFVGEAVQPIAVCPVPRWRGYYFGTRGPVPSNAYRMGTYVRDLRALNLTGIEAFNGGPLADYMLREGLTFMPHLEPRAYLTELKKDEEGNDVPNPWGGGRPGLLGLAGQAARDNARAGSAEVAAQAAAFPACSRVFTTADDFSALGGPDYTPANLEEFAAMTGLEAPRGPTAPAGIVPEEDPWLRWCMFLSRDVMGGLNDAIQRGAEKGAPGARVWPVPGGAQWPLLGRYSGQYPPVNFGRDWGYNTLGYYCYLGYWAPSLTYVYWSEVARMGNRDLSLWCMPDAGDSRHYQRNQLHLLLAGNTKGIAYFTYDWMGPQGRKEIAELGELLDRHGPLLGELAPAPKPLALLVPFTQASYSEIYPLIAGHVFNDLLLAKVEAEVLAEEEISTSNHRVILLAGVTHLRAAAAEALEAYVERGGVVLLDDDCTVEVSGATRLDLGLTRDASIRTYADPERVAAVRAALAPYLSPALDSPELTTVIRPFTSADGVRYAYVAQVDTQEEYPFYRSNLYEPAVHGREPQETPERIEEFLRERGMQNHLQDTTMTVVFDADLLPESGQVVEVYSGVVLSPQPAEEGRLAVQVSTRRFGAALLAFREASPHRVILNAPRVLPRGERGTVSIALADANGRRLPGAWGLEVTVRDGKGQVDPEVSGYYATDRGRLRLTLSPALLSAPGEWNVEARELASGLTGGMRLEVR